MNILAKSSIGSLLLTLFHFGASAQTIHPSEPLRVHADFSRYRGDERNLYIEVCYAFNQKGMTYKADTAGYVAGLDVRLTLMKNDTLAYQDRWLVPHVVKDTASVRQGLTLTGVTGVALGEGDYVMKLVGSDRYDTRGIDSVMLRVHVRMIDTQKIVLSDIELASLIRPGKKESPFYKNTLEVIPNVLGIFMDDQKFYFYAEAYNLLAGSDRSDYLVKTAIYDAVGKEITSREKPRKRVGESSVIVDNIPISSLKTGTYTLVMALLDSSKKIMTSSGKKFFVYNQTLGVDSTLASSGGSVSVSAYSSMSEGEMDVEFKWMRYEVTDNERTQYERLTSVDGKRKFLTEFWRRRPPGSKEEFLKRVGHVNVAFQIMGREGYRTDRGRVYLMYGPPDDYDRHPSDPDARPYEIWTYNSIQGGVLFVFVQRQSGGDYELVHSTHRNELHDENWQRYASGGQ